MTSASSEGRHPASFRDPSGFLFHRDGVLYRQVQPAYAAHFDLLKASGLYSKAVAARALVAHEEVALDLAAEPGAHAVLRPEVLPFISYPYEWCFGQLKSAALHTLKVQRLALEHGMTLKDASAYNIQFYGTQPVLIDTLSFEAYEEGRPWVAYRQFCQHFLAPLALAAYVDLRLLQLLRSHIDGVPLDLASRLLPFRTKLSPSLYAHLHLHAKLQSRHADDGRSDGGAAAKSAQVSARGMQGILESLRSNVEAMSVALPKTEWGDYYSDTNYSDASFEAKRVAVEAALAASSPKLVFDLGANTGAFTRIAAEQGAVAIACDVDPVAVERGFREAAEKGETRLQPLWIDLSNPSPALGWGHRERASLAERGPADLVLALALVHHLAIGNNVPLPEVARYFAELGRNLVIEFVPKSDSQVERLLATREDVFPYYDSSHFEEAFRGYFEIESCEAIAGTERSLYRMRRLEHSA